MEPILWSGSRTDNQPKAAPAEPQAAGHGRYNKTISGAVTGIRVPSSLRLLMFCRAIGARHRRTLAEHSRSFVSDDGREALSQFFQLVETRFGNIKSLMDVGPAAETIVTDGELRPDHLARLFAHDATALHVRNFYERGTAIRIGNDLIEESIHNTNNWKVSTSRGLESSDVGTLGLHSPFNVATAKARQQNQGEGIDPINEYFEKVRQEFKLRRRMPASANANETGQFYQFWPLDKLRLELEESWPPGAGLAREEASNKPYPRPFGGGLPRIMKGPTRWKRGFIHVDELGPLDPSHGLFSANIYVSLLDYACVQALLLCTDTHIRNHEAQDARNGCVQ